ncbi:glycoside hydrolase xylanase [Leptospira yasudae]|uniref:glycoside hydrolase xylanase n=1 Tax=Leptospira yasudae TaxID=2202201 RepID=UPI000E59E377|nr:glycoside hydrolase xylanase [Leptospira yasudae]RHX95939.1 glycoside hydrolase xylanase [Leptospira yasudae]
MKRILCTVLLLLFCSFLSNCFLNPLSQAVSETFFPTKEECKDCDQQRILAAAAAVFRPNIQGINAFAFDLSTTLSNNECASEICLGGFTDSVSDATITVTVPNGIVTSNLKATFAIAAGGKLEVDGVEQVSGVTANNFTSPVTYKFTDQSGATKNYTVTVNVAPSGDPVNGTIILTYSGSIVYLTKCTYGQVYRPGFNDCKGKGSASDNYGAITDSLIFCTSDDNSCDNGSSLTSGPLITACQSMENELPAMKVLGGMYSPVAPPDFNVYGSSASGALMSGCPGFSPTANPCSGGGTGGNLCSSGFSGVAINSTLFPDSYEGDYWTSTVCSATLAAKVSLIAPGLTNASLKSNVSASSKKALRCIRVNMS